MSLTEKLQLMEDINRHNDESIKRWARMTHGQEYEAEVKAERKVSRQCAVVLSVFFGTMIAAMIFDTLIASGCLK